jgi:RNA polymerase sigma factor (sigma-70 family)
MPQHRDPKAPPPETVYAGYHSRLRNFIRWRVPTPEDAEDILQEVFYQFTRMDSLAKPIEQTAAWLYRVARNMIANRHSKKRDAPFPVDMDENGDPILRDFADLLFDDEVTPETEYLRSLVWDEIETALAELPEDQRAIFEQTELLDIPVKEISRLGGVPVNTLLSRKHYAVVKLRRRLRNLYDELMGSGLVRSEE